MSEPTPPAARPGGNVFTRKIGPLPMWAWVAIVGGGLIAYELYKNNSASSSTTAAADSTGAAQVPQFVNQTFVSPAPPVSTGTGSAAGSGTTSGATSTTQSRLPKAASDTLTRVEATGGETWTQIAKQYGTTVANLKASTQSSPIDSANLKKFLASVAHPGRKPAKGTVFYVPAATGTPNKNPTGAGH